MTVAADIAERLFEARMDAWRALWRVMDLAALLEQAAGSEAEFRELSQEVCHTSWRNLHRWAQRSREVPEHERDPLHAPRTHLGWMKKGWL